MDLYQKRPFSSSDVVLIPFHGAKGPECWPCLVSRAGAVPRGVNAWHRPDLGSGRSWWDRPVFTPSGETSL